MMEREAMATAKAIMKNLEDRRGIGHELEAIKDQSPDIYAEIVQQIADEIEEALCEAYSEGRGN